MESDLTTGSVFKQSFNFSLPYLCIVLFADIICMADLIY